MTTENQENNFEGAALEFVDLFKNNTLNNYSLYSYITKAEALLKTYNSEIPTEAQAIDDLFKAIMEYAVKEPLLYGGYAYVFVFVAEKFDHWLEFNQELINEYSYKWDTMKSSGKNPVALVSEEATEANFKSIFISRFMFTLISVVNDLDEEELAELIVSCDMESYTFSENEECWICDLVIEILDVFGFSLDDYEGECEIYSRNFLSAGRTMGYDYIGLSQNFIGSFA
jgi:hypothetical protein